ncbi:MULTISPECIES: DUF1801 domain-containing protein [unclassified Agromyces]|uniref:DUF1801 domain-containing protein n=1 Tax=unclassified Agromyces TaxID=2639701 RepID=UPI003015862E
MAAESPAMRPTDVPVDEVLGRATGPRRAEADELVALCSDLTGEPPVVWAGRIIGFGEDEYRHDSGRSGRSPRLAFAPGPKHHTVYLPADFSERWPDLLAGLGAYRASKVCLYLTRLADVDRGVLRALLERALAETAASA